MSPPKSVCQCPRPPVCLLSLKPSASLFPYLSQSHTHTACGLLPPEHGPGQSCLVKTGCCPAACSSLQTKCLSPEPAWVLTTVRTTSRTRKSGKWWPSQTRAALNTCTTAGQGLADTVGVREVCWKPRCRRKLHLLKVLFVGTPGVGSLSVQPRLQDRSGPTDRPQHALRSRLLWPQV